MTCIAGVVEDGAVFIAGDSAGVSGFDLRVRRDAKVWERDGWVFGFTSSFRMGQLLRWAFKPPVVTTSTDLDRYMATTFIDEVRKVLKDGGYTKVDQNQEEGGTFLVGYHGRLFNVCEDFQVGEALSGFDAVGCGAPYALGALHALQRLEMDPSTRLGHALKAAEDMSAGVRGPFVVARTA